MPPSARITRVIVLTALLAPAMLAAQATPAAPLAVARVAQWGCAECGGAAQFGDILDVAVRDGRVYVLDRDVPLVRVFDLTGRAQRTFGRRGGGPGEVQAPLRVAVAGDGTVRLLDTRPARVAVLAASGTPRDGVRLDPSAGFPTAAAALPNGEGLAIAVTDFREATGVLRLRASDAVTVPLLPRVQGLPPEPSGVPTITSLAVAADGSLALAGSAIDAYHVLRFDAGGRALPALQREIPRTRRTPEEVAALRERLRTGPGAAMRRAEAGKTRAPAAGGTTGPDVDPLRPHFGYDALRYDDAGRLWVRTMRGGETRTVFDVFDRQGRLLGEVVVPAPLGAFAFAGDTLVAESHDGDDVPVVTVWRVSERR